MKQQIPGSQQAHDRHHFEIAPVASDDDLARGRRRDQHEEGDIDRRRGDPADRRRHQDRGASRDPGSEQRQQRRALDRQPPGPVRNRREQKTRHDGRHKAVQHLMHVPIARDEHGRKLNPAAEERQPDQHRKRRVDRPHQEEGAKAVGQKRGPAILAQTRDACHGCLSDAPAAYLAAVRFASSLPNRLTNTCLARPGCVTALASVSLAGVPTTIMATMPMP